MHIVDSKLNLVMQPVSIKQFNAMRKDKKEKEYLDQASLYIIAKREVPVLNIISIDSVKNSVAICIKDYSRQKWTYENL